jgi:hypothetical protein
MILIAAGFREYGADGECGAGVREGNDAPFFFPTRWDTVW